MNVLDFLAIVIPAALQSWPFVVLVLGLVLLFRYKDSIENLASRITLVTRSSIVFSKLDLPQPPPLRELNVSDTIAVRTSLNITVPLRGLSMLASGGRLIGSLS